VALCAEHYEAIAASMAAPERVNPHLLWPWVDHLVRAPPLLEAVCAARGRAEIRPSARRQAAGGPPA
jgi:hypothetical protein